MRKMSVACLAVLLTVILSDKANAYYLDSPHNGSNGIACGDCHTMSAWGWPNGMDPSDPTNPDKTTRNAVCNNCHGTDPADVDRFVTKYVPGPKGHLHASSTTDTFYGNWATQCIDCHDPHFQPQLDWVLTDYDKLYVGEGYFDSQPTPSGSNTKINIVGYTGKPGFADVSLWKAKGGETGAPNIDPTRAADGSRGLQLVPDKSDPNIIGTYEIIDITGNVMTIKGALTGDWRYKNFGVIYGQAITSFMLEAHGNGFKDVKFFRPDLIAGDSGGWVDLRPSEPTPVGLCQVCHAATYWWKTDSSGQGHNPAVSCDGCHVAENGFAHFAHRSQFITGPPECGSCHSQHLTETDWGHGSCSYCHSPSFIPAVNTSVTLTIEGVSPYAALLAAGYSFDGTDGRLRDSGGKTVSDPGFTAINCTTCHAVNAFNFYEHSSNPHNLIAATTGGACEICHSAENSPFVAPEGFIDPPGVTTILPPRVTTNLPPGEAHYRLACFHCHDSESGVLLGSALQHAIGNTSDCMTCHDETHHYSKHANVVFDPAVDVALMFNQGPFTCVTHLCHDNLTEDETSLDTWEGILAEHDKRDGVWDGVGGCSTCHEYDGTNGVYNLSPVAAVAAALVPGGGTITCTTCHPEKLPPP